MNEKIFNPTKMSNPLNFNCTKYLYRKKTLVCLYKYFKYSRSNALIIICSKYS